MAGPLESGCRWQGSALGQAACHTVSLTQTSQCLSRPQMVFMPWQSSGPDLHVVWPASREG